MPDVLDGVASNETVAFRLVQDIADTATPSLATEYNATSSVPLECLMIDPVSPDATLERVQLRRACSRNVRERNGRITRTIADLVGVYDPQDLAAEVSKAYVALEEGSVWFLVIRWGVHVDTAAIAGDLVDIYKIEVGVRTKIQAAENDELQFKASISVLDFWEDVALAA